ncbi:MAG: 3-phosphoglycerate dehydrogenase [Acidobacteria bacterium]|jgi:D-3-phosphoglycerate dehydrogenase / 2-oxoglutarate reductase|nr:3-phosphoglycerate dehydrogenase [Acidobacteriota bacterium]
MFNIQTLNNISPVGLARLPKDRFTTGADLSNPDAILLRSADLHTAELGSSLKAIGRAGAGVNNIPVTAMTARGIPVFNAPGANANAVKELVIAALIMSCRQIVPAALFAREQVQAASTPEELKAAVEKGKKMFAGYELPGRTLAVIGLGAIGGRVANAAAVLGMRVVGYDPGLTLDGAWQLSASIQRARSLDEALRTADFVTAHVPLGSTTRNLIDADRLKAMKPRVVVLNFAREGIVNEAAMVEALDMGHAHGYISDFPTALTTNHPKCITLPHLGASTGEAEDNCAVMVADQVRDFLEHGSVRNAVNFPELVASRQSAHRCLCLVRAAEQSAATVSDSLTRGGAIVAGLASATRNEMVYVVADTTAPVPDPARARVAALDGLIMLRSI